MCITCRSKLIPRIAKKDIVVYKALKPRADGTLRSPFANGIYVLGHTKKETLQDMVWNERAKMFETHRGLYSYNEIGKAERTAEFMTSREYKAYVYKCVIPEGSKYIAHRKQVVSNQLLVQELIPMENTTNDEKEQ